MSSEIPYHVWLPLSIHDVRHLLAGASFTWGLAGGYAIEQFLGTSIRTHEDVDIIVFRDEEHQVQGWLKDWHLYAADPPGTLRRWNEGEYLRPDIHDVWGHRIGTNAWQLQIMLVEVDGAEWVSRRNEHIRGPRDELIVMYNDVPCIRVEVQLLYKARGRRPKDETDFQACLPRLDAEAKQWLKTQLQLLYPEGHAWLTALS